MGSIKENQSHNLICLKKEGNDVLAVPKLRYAVSCVVVNSCLQGDGLSPNGLLHGLWTMT